MTRLRSYNKRNLLFIVVAVLTGLILLTGRLLYLMVLSSEAYALRAEELHERERGIKAERGKIYDRNGEVLATNKPVSTISVIHNQIKEPETVIKELSSILDIDEAAVRKRVEKYTSIERIKANVDKETADRLRALKLEGVMIDEDYKRYYPYSSLASRVLGFTGSDNQGILGLEVKYDSFLQGSEGKILTLTTAHGIEIENAAEKRLEPVAGSSLYVSLDMVIQRYAEQLAMKVREAKSAKQVSIIVMNPKNGEIYAMANVPEFDLNQPYVLTKELQEQYGDNLTAAEKTEKLNEMWKNNCIHNTYEPGSAFKIVTAIAALEDGKVKESDTFHCPGYRKVADRIIRCHKTTGHGSETFIQGIMNSCNPVFMDIGARVGSERMYYYFRKLGLFSKTGIDLPGEANSIMHKLENIKEVELATVSFGQSFQITPLQLMVAASAVANGGTLVTPHFGTMLADSDGNIIHSFRYETMENVISEENADRLCGLLEKVISEGTGKRAYLEGYRVAGKTATSEKLPRSENRYIASFLGFAPAEDPEVMAMALIDEPQGIYYGGTIAAPVVAELFDNILPYLGVEAVYEESE